MTCPFVFDDGAYVLGALAPAERAAFEHHLAGCHQCRESVAALAVLPGLLGRLDGGTAAAIDASGTAMHVPSALLPRTLAAAGLQRRRERQIRRWRQAAASLVAACLIALVGFAVHVVDQRPETNLASMRPATVALPVSGEIGLTSAPGGTRILMRCRYDVGYPGSWVVHLVVYPRSGPVEQVGTWTAIGGQEVSITAVTHLSQSQIDKLELQSDSGATLLTWNA
jgi:Putative zinc-finger